MVTQQVLRLSSVLCDTDQKSTKALQSPRACGGSPATTASDSSLGSGQMMPAWLFVSQTHFCATKNLMPVISGCAFISGGTTGTAMLLAATTPSARLLVLAATLARLVFYVVVFVVVYVIAATALAFVVA